MARILVVDDDPSVLGSVARYLRSKAHEVAEAGNGLEAVTALREAGGTIELVITDINMPDMDGIELLSAVHGHDESVPVIAMSGGGLISKEFLLANAGMLRAFATVPKPLDPLALDAVIDAALKARASGEPWGEH